MHCNDISVELLWLSLLMTNYTTMAALIPQCGRPCMYWRPYRGDERTEGMLGMENTEAKGRLPLTFLEITLVRSLNDLL